MAKNPRSTEPSKVAYADQTALVWDKLDVRQVELWSLELKHVDREDSIEEIDKDRLEQHADEEDQIGSLDIRLAYPFDEKSRVSGLCFIEAIFPIAPKINFSVEASYSFYIYFPVEDVDVELRHKVAERIFRINIWPRFSDLFSLVVTQSANYLPPLPSDPEISRFDPTY